LLKVTFQGLLETKKEYSFGGKCETKRPLTDLKIYFPPATQKNPISLKFRVNFNLVCHFLRNQ